MPFSKSGNDAWSYNRFDAYEAALKGEVKEEEVKTEEKEEVQESSCGSKGYQEGGEVKCDKCDGKGCEHCEGKGTHKKGEKKEEEVKEGAKPDFLDMDKDGNKEEPMKKAISDKKTKGLKKEVKESSCGSKGYQEGGEIQYPTGKKQKFTKDKTDPKVAAGRKAAKEMGLLKKEELESYALFSDEEIEALLGKF